MADGMAEIENAAQTSLMLVRGNDFGLQLYGLGNQPLQLHGIALQDLAAILFEAKEEFHVSDYSALQRFIEAGAEFAVGQRLEDGRINQNHPRMVKRSQHVLPC